VTKKQGKKAGRGTSRKVTAEENELLELGGGKEVGGGSGEGENELTR